MPAEARKKFSRNPAKKTVFEEKRGTKQWGVRKIKKVKGLPSNIPGTLSHDGWRRGFGASSKIRKKRADRVQPVVGLEWDSGNPRRLFTTTELKKRRTWGRSGLILIGVGPRCRFFDNFRKEGENIQPERQELSLKCGRTG